MTQHISFPDFRTTHPLSVPHILFPDFRISHPFSGPHILYPDLRTTHPLPGLRDIIFSFCIDSILWDYHLFLIQDCYTELRCDCHTRPSDRNRHQCDAYCGLYGDCAFEYQTCPRETNSTYASAIRAQRPYMSCVPLVYHSVRTTFLSVNRCPTSFTDSYIVERCQNASNFILDNFYSRVRVRHSLTGIEYRNVYCALCNGQAVTDAMFWRMESLDYFCRTSAVPSRFKPRDLVRTHLLILSALENDTCVYAQIPFPHTTAGLKLRHCLNSVKPMIESCPVGSPLSSQYDSQCKEYYAPGTNSTHNFRNHFCAKCHNASDITCTYSIPVKVEKPNFQKKLNYMALIAPVHVVSELHFESGCGLGFELYKGVCLRNPLLPIYRSPVFINDDVVLRSIFQFSKTLVFVGGNELANQTYVADQFSPAFRQVSRINSLTVRNVSGIAPARRLKGGYEITFGEQDITFEIHFKMSNKSMELLYEAMSNIGVIMVKLGGPALMFVMTKYTQEPIRCENGTHVKIEMNSTLLNFFEDTGRLDTIFNSCLITRNTSQQYIFHVCQVDAFRTCESVSAFKAEDFVNDGDRIQSLVTNARYPRSQVMQNEHYVLMCSDLKPDKFPTIHDKIQYYLSIVAMSLSLVGLAFLLLTYGIHSQLRNVPGVMIMNLSAVLFLAYLLFLVGMPRNENVVVCSIIGALIHYLWLVAFSWMSVISYSTAQTFRSPFVHPARNISAKCLIAYCSPILVVFVCVTLHYASDLVIYGVPQPGRGVCWISHPIVFYVAFIGPLLVSFVINIIMFTMTAFAISSAQKSGETLSKNCPTKPQIFLYIKLSVLMGTAWIFGLLNVVYPNLLFGYLFIIFNASNGLFLGIFFGITSRSRHLYSVMLRPSGSLTQSTRQTGLSKVLQVPNVDPKQGRY